MSIRARSASAGARLHPASPRPYHALPEPGSHRKQRRAVQWRSEALGTPDALAALTLEADGAGGAGDYPPPSLPY